MHWFQRASLSYFGLKTKKKCLGPGQSTRCVVQSCYTSEASVTSITVCFIVSSSTHLKTRFVPLDKVIVGFLEISVVFIKDSNVQIKPQRQHVFLAVRLQTQLERSVQHLQNINFETSVWHLN